MKKALIKSFFCMVTLILAICIAGQCQLWAKEKPIKLLWGTFDPPMALFSQVTKRWAKELEEQTGGKVKVDCSFGFGKPGEIFNLVEQGVIDFGPCIPSFNPGQFPLSDIVQLPFVIPTAETGSKAMTKFVNKGYKDPAYESVKTLFFMTCSSDSILLKNKAIAKVEDLKGLKIHAGGPQISQRMKLMGAVPSYVHYPELYPAIQKGVIDGMVMGYAVIEIFRLHEVLKYAVEPPMGTGAVVHVMNKKKWDRLPADIQKTMDGLSKKYCIENGRAWDAGCERSKKLFLDAGGRIIELSASEINKANQLIKPMWEGWIAAMERKVLPGKKAVDDMYIILKELGVENPAIGYAPDHL